MPVTHTGCTTTAQERSVELPKSTTCVPFCGGRFLPLPFAAQGHNLSASAGLSCMRVETRVFVFRHTTNKVIRLCKMIYQSGYFHSLLCSSSLHMFIFLFLSLHRPSLPFVFCTAMIFDTASAHLQRCFSHLPSLSTLPSFLARCSCIQISTGQDFFRSCLYLFVKQKKKESRAEFMHCSADNILFSLFLCSVCGRHTGFLFLEVCVHLLSCLSFLISHIQVTLLPLNLPLSSLFVLTL